MKFSISNHASRFGRNHSGHKSPAGNNGGSMLTFEPVTEPSINLMLAAH